MKRRKLTKRERELKESWEQLVKKTAPRCSTVGKGVPTMVQPSPYRRETVQYPSVDSGVGSATKPVEGKQYTGGNIVGIGTLHKSNAIPIFSESEAKDIANMRR